MEQTAILLKIDEENKSIKIYDGSEKELKFMDFVLPYVKRISLDTKVIVTTNTDNIVVKVTPDKSSQPNNIESQKPANTIPETQSTFSNTQKNNRNGLDINPAFIVRIQGSEFITYNGLLAVAEKKGGIQKKEVLRLDVSEDQKSALAHCRVTMKSGEIFEDVGTCTPMNSKSVTTYAPEMAVTRGFARAIRTGLNVDYCSKEEVS